MTFFNQPDLSLDDVRSLLENHFLGRSVEAADHRRHPEGSGDVL